MSTSSPTKTLALGSGPESAKRGGRAAPRILAVGGVVLLLLILGAVTQGAGPTLQSVVDGLRLGLVLSLIGVGLSLIFSTTGIFNFAQGEFATLGAGAALLLNSGLGLPLILSALVAVALGAAFGITSEKLLWRALRARRVGTISTLVVAIGLGIALRNLLLAFMGGSSRSYTEFAVQSPVRFGGVDITPKALWSIAVCLVALGLLALFLKRTRAGQAIRAVADDPTLASATGIATGRQLTLVWAIGSAFAALGGVLLGLVEQVRWDMGNQLLLLVIAGVTLGGLGTVLGAVIGSALIGIATQASTLWIPAELKYVTALALLVLILLFRPQGLFGRKERVA
ncbi:branched-chain amino acid ABC transporter permease [Leucobacter sp. wl10]|uniref:branched-chain amino acid ABC transporter permease n=1 Tax=Leucobacter sp. wl10 TaxID=2304677 RepID=UPI000E5A5A2F|nr:branched-chain amino acid ABC transporter permease [Leucobacter sp. wl10]RGE21129.1 branched-chain amino acid ABC transporter permease [Leucobacter sp. wl10]